ncbi:unnamed protein product [Rhizophagus irregularis]|nr:unnamed protein product [Rhizophagus irregularis]CAB5379335.1 unnamed protein product [Rhizophagus irregularis]
MNVKGGGIIPYCKTRWTTAFQSISDVLRLQNVLEEIYIIYRAAIIIIINRRLEEFDENNYLLTFFLHPGFRSTDETSGKIKHCACLKYSVWSRIVQIAGAAAQNMGMDLAASRILCSQLLLYKNNEAPFNQPYNEGFDDPISWGLSSCERGFSMCGWITNKRQLRLEVERLESITKLISYYRSNAYSEFGFYGKNTKKESVKLNNSEINIIVNDSLAEPDEDNDDEINEELQERHTTDKCIVPNYQVIVLIENTLNVLHPRILSGLGEFPDDNLDNDLDNDLDDNDKNNNNDSQEEIDEDGIEEETGRGVMDFSVEDLLKE